MEPKEFFQKIKKEEFFFKKIRKGVFLLKFFEAKEDVETLYVTNSFKVIFILLKLFISHSSSCKLLRVLLLFNLLHI